MRDLGLEAHLCLSFGVFRHSELSHSAPAALRRLAGVFEYGLRPVEGGYPHPRALADNHRMPDRIPLSNDEIEVACDLLWFVKRESDLSTVGEALWERLQPIRHGDYGGSASTELSLDEARAVIVAGEFSSSRVPLDEDETALVSRLRSLVP